MTVSLRPIEPDDNEFLFAVYASTRTEELRLVDWDADQKEAFLRMQHTAQHAFYTQHYPTAQFQIILADGQPAGRLYVDVWTSEIRIMDIAVLPEFRRRGIATGLLCELLRKAEDLRLRVTIHVEKFNPATKLYQRLGFRAREDKGVYLLMEWTPSQSTHPQHL